MLQFNQALSTEELIQFLEENDSLSEYSDVIKESTYYFIRNNSDYIKELTPINALLLASLLKQLAPIVDQVDELKLQRSL